MFRKNILINIILVALTIFLGLKVYKIWTRPLSLTPAQAQQKTAGEKPPEAAPEAEQMPVEEIFQPIVQNDVFRSARNEPKPEEISKPVAAAPVIPPKLFGTVIYGDLKTAILEDPATKLSKIYRINESVGGFVLSDIQKDKVVLSRDGEITEVYLREIKAFKPQPSPVPQPPQRGRRDMQGMPSPQPRPAPQPPQPPPQPPDVPPMPEEEGQQ
ncbi:MAG: hypothetical protein HY806_09315 [Nitrospirae bacterium]|nr:hypothetical protein [Nitrospirota bacterium]